LGVEHLADTASAGWWPVETGAVAERLQTAEAQIALLMICALVALRVVTAVFTRKERHGEGSSAETLQLTAEGPIFAGAKARLTILNEAEPKVFEGVVHSLDNQFLVLSVPAAIEGKVRIGSSVKALFPIANVAYRFTGIVQDSKRTVDGAILYFRKPEWLERIQQRSHFRVKLNQAASVSLVDSNKPSNSVYSGFVLNVSSAGISICLPLRPPSGSILRVKIEHECLADARYEVRVIRTGPARIPHTGMWVAGCEFLWMDEASQARLTRACMELERRTRPAV